MRNEKEMLYKSKKRKKFCKLGMFIAIITKADFHKQIVILYLCRNRRGTVYLLNYLSYHYNQFDQLNVGLKEKQPILTKIKNSVPPR